MEEEKKERLYLLSKTPEAECTLPSLTDLVGLPFQVVTLFSTPTGNKEYAKVDTRFAPRCV